MRGAGAVIHSHGMEACLATMIHPGAKEFRVKRKGTLTRSMPSAGMMRMILS